MGLNCPACDKDFQAEEVTWLSCGHLFHTACLELHRTSGRGSASVCPQCRSPYTKSMRLYLNIQNDSNVDDLKMKLKEKADKLQQVTDMHQHLISHIVKLDGIILSQTQKISKLEEENKVYADMILKNPVHTMPQPVQSVASSIRRQSKFSAEKLSSFAESFINETQKPKTLELESTKKLKDLSDSNKSELIKLDAVLDRTVIITGMSKIHLQMTTLEFLRSLANVAHWFFDDNDIVATYRRGWNLQNKELIVLFKTTNVKWRMFKMQSSLKEKPDWNFIIIKSAYKHDVWELYNYAKCLLEHGYKNVYIYSAKVWAKYGNCRRNILDHAHVDRLKAAAETSKAMNLNTTEVKGSIDNEKNASECHLKGIAPKKIEAKRNAAKERKENTTPTERKDSTTSTEHISLPEFNKKFLEYMRKSDFL